MFMGIYVQNNKSNIAIKKIESVAYYKGIAMVMVIIVHLSFAFDGLSLYISAPCLFGQMGCQIFFVLSAFCLCLSYEKSNHHTLQFYKKRFFSIAPGWWATILINLLFAKLSILICGSNIFWTAVNMKSVLINVFFLNGLANNYTNNLCVRGGWYIGTTIVLYFLFPLLFYVYKKYRESNICLIQSLVLLQLFNAGIIYILAQVGGKWVIENNNFMYFSFITQLPCFCMGILCYHYITQNNFKISTKKKTFIWSAFISITLCVFLFYSNLKYSFIFVPTLMGVGFSCLFCLTSNNKYGGGIRQYIKILGNSSYYIYLLHTFIVWDLARWFVSNCSINQNFLFIIAIPISILAVHLIGAVFERIVVYISRN